MVQFAQIPALGRDIPTRVAAIDLGTNNCRLMVADVVGEGRLRVVDTVSRPVRLGEGLVREGVLGHAAKARAINALAHFAARLRALGVVRYRAVATQGCREARDGVAFLADVQRRTGLRFELLTPEEEARLAASACLDLVDPEAARALVVDIGGGSTELVVVDGRAVAATGSRAVMRPPVVQWASVPLGVVSLAESTGVDFEAMLAHARVVLAGALSWADIPPQAASHLVATSGVVTSLTGMHFGLTRPDRRSVEGAWLSRPVTDALIGRLLSTPAEARDGLPCVGAGRGDLVTAGSAILTALWDLWPAARLRATDRGLREGLILHLARQNQTRSRNLRRRA
jgi:exopolyphosphatase/guanosine-5'-triphosphate,3'-diphosphate pyrophosphatase